MDPLWNDCTVSFNTLHFDQHGIVILSALGNCAMFFWNSTHLEIGPEQHLLSRELADRQTLQIFENTSVQAEKEKSGKNDNSGRRISGVIRVCEE